MATARLESRLILLGAHTLAADFSLARTTGQDGKSKTKSHFWPAGFTILNTLQITHAQRSHGRLPRTEHSSEIESLAYRHGVTYDSYLATEPDRQIFRPRGASGAAAYVRAGRYVHVAGGLLAPAEDKRGLLSEMIQWADRERLVMSFYNLTDQDLPLAREFGFQVTKWGEEALVDLSSATWSGKPYEWLRRQVNYCRRQQLVGREYDQSAGTFEDRARIASELVEISQAQLGRKPQRHEIRFLEGRFDTVHLGRRRLFIAQSDDGRGRIEGFLLCNPCLNGSGWAFETYRRRPDAIRGAMPFLMYQTMRQLQAENVATVSLCLVPGLRCETPLAGDSPLARWSMVMAARYFSFIHDTRGLYHYKSRFRPGFANRYLAVRPRFSLGAAWSFVRVLGVLDLSFGNLARQSLERLRAASSRRTLSTPEPLLRV